MHLVFVSLCCVAIRAAAVRDDSDTGWAVRGNGTSQQDQFDTFTESGGKVHAGPIQKNMKEEVHGVLHSGVEPLVHHLDAYMAAVVQRHMFASIREETTMAQIKGTNIIATTLAKYPQAFKWLWNGTRWYWYKIHTELIPGNEHARPFAKPNDPCGFVTCDPTSPRRGVGRDGSVLHWALAVIIPFITVLTIIIGTSYRTKHARGCLQVKFKSAFVAMVGASFFSSCISFSAILLVDHPSSYTLAGCCSISIFFAILCQIATLSFVGVEFNWPDFSPSPFLQIVGMLRMVIYYILYLFFEFFVVVQIFVHIVIPPHYYSTVEGVWIGLNIFFFEDLVPMLFIASTPPSLASFAWLCIFSRSYVVHFYYYGDTTGSSMSGRSCLVLVKIYMYLVSCVLTCFVNHHRDRQFVAVLCFLISKSTSNGLIVSGILSDGDDTTSSLTRWLFRTFLVSSIVVSVVVAFASCIAMRYRRVLPDVLRNAQYIRVSHFFKMQRQGLKLTRCQEVPPIAFGNVAKARYLIIVSHRWLDRYTCDVATQSCPLGLRLTTMCQRFDRFFPSSCHAFAKLCSTPVSAMIAALTSVLYADNDVLVFFDFMSLPQIGKMSDGSIIERTPEEQELFQAVLPAMGSLYTMYDVLMCPEVVDTAPPYFSSGWCFCEWSQASLNNKLSNYAIDSDKDIIDQTVASWASDLVSRPAEFMDAFEIELHRKRFYFESDKNIVSSIARGTLTRRMLVDAVYKQDVRSVDDFLGQLSDRGLTHTINHAVDHESLDTLLHVAMKLPSKEIVDALINFGADVESLNWRGDTPAEFFMINRAWLRCL